MDLLWSLRAGCGDVLQTAAQSARLNGKTAKVALTSQTCAIFQLACAMKHCAYSLVHLVFNETMQHVIDDVIELNSSM